MLSTLFKNPKAALGYAAITLIGAGIAVGTPEEPGTLQNTVNTLSSGKNGTDASADRAFGSGILGGPEQDRGGSRDDAVVDYADEDDLIDRAEGFDAQGFEAQGYDPRPTQDFSGIDPTPSAERPYLADQDKE